MKAKNILRIVIGTALILSVPLLAMQFTDEVNWNWFDFAIIGTLLLGTGLAYELAAAKIDNTTHRAVVGMVLLAALFLVWAELAVGIFGSPIAGS